MKWWWINENSPYVRTYVSMQWHGYTHTIFSAFSDTRPLTWRRCKANETNCRTETSDDTGPDGVCDCQQLKNDHICIRPVCVK